MKVYDNVKVIEFSSGKIIQITHDEYKELRDFFSERIRESLCKPGMRSLINVGEVLKLRSDG